ncbi:MAG: hypothetical protein HDQ88_02215, partial [Clostridia bacterium]|nr:hypothetical protein [Clostridia bacterium]
MADNNMKTTTKKVNGNFFARAGELLGKGLGEYFESATPSAYSIVNELKTTPKEIAELFTTTTQSLTTKYNQFIRLPLFRNISGWFYKEAQSYENDEEDLDFDGLDDEENAEGAAAAAQMSEAKQNTNQLSKVIIQSIGKSVEANNVALSAQKDLIEKQTNVISSGFDAVNNTLKSLTEIITKNSATLIESSVAGSSGGSDVTEDPRKKLLTQGFDASDYKELIKQNFNDLDSSGFMGIVHDFITGSKEDLEEMMSAENIAKIGIPWLIEKIAPNLEDELGNFDKILSDSITSGLIKLGAQASDDGPMGLLGKIFGIDTSRQNVANEKSQLSLQSIPWDTVSKSALTNAIPGYLRKILVQLGGDDLVFDYRSGSFRSEKAIKREFEQAMVYNTMDNLGDSDKRIRDKFDTNDAAQNKSNQMLYSMLLTKLSADMDDGTAQDDLKNMTSIAKARQYVNKMVDGVIDVDENLQKQMDEFARGLYNVTRDTNARNAMTDQAAKNEVLRQEHGNEYVKNAKAMDINLHNWQDSVLSEQKTIARMFDANVVKKSQTDSSNQIKAPKKRGATEYLEFLSTQVGAYISEAVYRIWHRLDSGINVYQVGHGSLANSPFKPDTSSLLPPGSVLQFRETKGDVPVTKNSTSNAGGKKANQPEYDPN